MPKGYHHLTMYQRCQLSVLKERGYSIINIAASLKIHRSTIYRELHRNSLERNYCHKKAHESAFGRRYIASHRKRKMQIDIHTVIEEKLALQWSPVQISGWLKEKEYKTRVSHETIYRYIWADKKQGGSLYKQLRHSHKKYNKRSKGKAGRGCIPNRIDISMRPEIVELKERIGDWELDTIISKGRKGAIVSMVERRSRLTKLALVSKNTALEVSDAICSTLHPMKSTVITLTSDNGKEFAYHEDISLELGANFYFARPYHSWERGLNEHTNGLVRQYFPKATRFNRVTNNDLKEVEVLLNNRPRKVLNFATPSEVFDQLTKNDTVALHS